jgi:hypothetical protein
MTDQKIDGTQYGFPPGLSQPALRALVGAGYTSLEQVAAAGEVELLALHGVGPKAIRIFREAGVSFAGEGAAGRPAEDATAEEMAAPDEGGDGITAGEATADEGAAFAVDAIAEVVTVEAHSAAEQMLLAAKRGQPPLEGRAGRPMPPEELIQAWRDTYDDPGASWALFAHGTLVVPAEPEGDLAAAATALLEEYGTIQFGTASADFAVVEPEHGRGWVVTSHRPEILTFVGREEAAPYTDEITVGLMGRAKRGRDAEERRIIHVEDRRG